MPHLIAVRHNFEAAHRLPHLQGKCQSLHGHSWWARFVVGAPQLAAGMVAEFGPYKKLLREWIDAELDHGSMLGPEDPLLPILRAHDCKVYEVQGWPTVENVAMSLAHQADRLLHEVVRAPDARVVRVDVQETAVNQASWVSDAC